MIVGLILAAGKGTRMGQNKMLVPFRGKPLLEHVLSAAENSRLDELIIVLGYEAEKIRAFLKTRNRAQHLTHSKRLFVRDNDSYDKGLSSSLKKGVGTLKEAQAVMVLLGDMPFISTQTIDTLLSHFKTETDIIAPSFEGKIGNPIIWGKAYFPHILSLEGDKGARSLLQQFSFTAINLDTSAITIDLDTPEALAAFQK